MKFVCLIVGALITCAQSFAFAPSWYKYYNHINNAEQLICKGDYGAACKQYKMACAINDTSIANINLYNAFHTGMMSGDTTFAKNQLHGLLQRGLHEKFISNHILKYYSVPQQQCIRAWVDLYKGDTIVPSAMALYVQGLVDQDQGVRSYSSDLNDGSVNTDTVRKVDAKVQKELFDTLQKHTLGINAIGNGQSGPFNGLAYNIIILHNIQMAESGENDFLFWSVVNKGLEQFSITPNEALMFALAGPKVVTQKYMGSKEPLMFECLGYNDSLFIPKIDKSKIAKINTIRQQYGLCTIEDEITKINYANKMGDKNRFYIDGAKQVMDTEQKEQLDKWLKKAVYPWSYAE
ncbi:hypothetical protein [Taibaiella soli]|uniref:Tetratricopeptide repeat protein n=1 Tax=Taibaiella soli TaxID=1649169 RepID=A0A2W2BCH6_9BACT|nr:hypothetical protein [Taibaiella soli]PZF73577.1 hypothetical protein DN068_07595 [Taibaiella soli]